MTAARALKVVDASAEAAAADAARDALAEAAKAPRTTGTDKAEAPGRDGWYRFVVDVWITDFNFTEFGLYKRQRNKAKSRQFTSDMDIFAEVIENGERTGLLGYREDLWRQAEGMDRRLVFKLFTGNLGWRATADLMLGRSLQQTIGARGLPVMSYSINTDDDNFMIYLERSANKWPFMPEHFSFFLMDEKGKPEFYRLRQALIDLGGDYSLLNDKGEVVGHLDGKVFSIGGKWKGKVKAGYASKRLLTVMKLFAGMIVFNGECRRHMRKLYRDIKAGRIEPKLERQELDLYMNPRRVR
jgi:hypothetical protein